MPERVPTPEFSPAELELIEKLREQGVEDPETRELLIRWTKEEEARANALNTPRANIELNLKRARLYRAAGFWEAAWENLESVRQQAAQEGAEDLYHQAMAMMDEIDIEPKQ